MLHRKIPWNNSPWGLSAAKGLSRGGVGEDTRAVIYGGGGGGGGGGLYTVYLSGLSIGFYGMYILKFLLSFFLSFYFSFLLSSSLPCPLPRFLL